MPENKEIPPDICPNCYHPRSAHAADCDYEQKLAGTKRAEGITPEFEQAVKVGMITFDQQMAELGNKLEKVFHSRSTEESESNQVNHKPSLSGDTKIDTAAEAKELVDQVIVSVKSV